MGAHYYPKLVSCWRKLAARAGFRMQRIARTGGHDVYGITTGTAGARGERSSPCAGLAGAPPGGYLSAGIHGDEPAGVWALLDWAGARAHSLRRREWVIMPCLNPWGLMANSRWDSQGRDLNRSFHLDRVPVVAGWKRFIGRRRFLSPAIALHEDYEGDGIYAYYLGPDPAAAKRGIRAASRFIRPSLNRKVDRKWRQEGGIVRLPGDRRPVLGVEGRHLVRHHVAAVTTIETPSELALDLRIRAHVAYLDAVAGPLLAL